MQRRSYIATILRSSPTPSPPPSFINRRASLSFPPSSASKVQLGDVNMVNLSKIPVRTFSNRPPEQSSKLTNNNNTNNTKPEKSVLDNSSEFSEHSVDLMDTCLNSDFLLLEKVVYETEPYRRGVAEKPEPAIFTDQLPEPVYHDDYEDEEETTFGQEKITTKTKVSMISPLEETVPTADTGIAVDEDEKTENQFDSSTASSSSSSSSSKLQSVIHLDDSNRSNSKSVSFDSEKDVVVESEDQIAESSEFGNDGTLAEDCHVELGDSATYCPIADELGDDATMASNSTSLTNSVIQLGTDQVEHEVLTRFHSSPSVDEAIPDNIEPSADEKLEDSEVKVQPSFCQDPPVNYVIHETIFADVQETKLGDNELKIVPNRKPLDYHDPIEMSRRLLRRMIRRTSSSFDEVRLRESQLAKSCQPNEPVDINQVQAIETPEKVQAELMEPEPTKADPNETLEKVPADLETLERQTEALKTSKKGSDEPGRGLLTASEQGNTDLARFYVNNGAGVNARNAYDETPLILAAEYGRQTTVELLFSRGADVTCRDDFGFTPLICSSKGGYLTIARMLTARGADVNMPDREGATALMWAVQYSHKLVVRHLVEVGANVNLQDRRNWSALSHASAFSIPSIVRYLLMNGADLEHRTDNGQTPLMLAASRWTNREDSLKIVQMLIGEKANVFAVDKANRNVLMLASQSGNYPVYKELVRRFNFDLNHQCSEGSSALMNASKFGWLSIVKNLVARGADVNLVDAKGRSAVSEAAKHGHDDILAYLLLNGARTDCRDSATGSTALIEAANRGSLAAVRMLCNHGASWDDKDVNGEGALEIATTKGHKEIVRYIKSRIAKRISLQF